MVAPWRKLKPNSAASDTIANVTSLRLDAHVKNAITGTAGKNWRKCNAKLLAVTGFLTAIASSTADPVVISKSRRIEY